MTPWQVLRAGRASQVALGYRVHHGPGVSVHYNTAAAAPASPHSSRIFCLSREKLTLQQLNRRLALYLQQVQCLEAANQMLERQIQEELDRKCPRDLRELDGHLRTVSLLQDQISDCLSAQAQVKLQLLSAELTIFDFNVGCERECEHRGRLEAELSNLRLLEEELKVHKLPELQSLLNDQRQQLMELQIQHQQDRQGLLAQVSRGITVEMQRAESSDLIQQLDDLRLISVMVVDKNQNQCWFNAQVLSSPEVTFHLPDVAQTELVELRRAAASLEEELTQLQALNILLENSGQEQAESFILQLVVLQQREDGLCRDLDSVLQAAAQQAADHHALLDIKNKLETEIQDYKRLLDGLGREGVSSLHLNSNPTFMSSCASTFPTVSGKVMPDRVISVHGGNLQMMEVQTVSRDHIWAVRQTPLVTPFSEAVTTNQSISVLSKQSKKSPLTSINTLNLNDSSENLRTEALPRRTTRESINVGQMSQCLDKGAVVKVSKMEINPATTGITMVPDTQIEMGADVQTKPETFTSKQTTREASSQDNKTGTHIQTKITKTIPGAETEIKQGSHFVTQTTTSDPGKEVTETMILPPQDHIEGYIQAKKTDLAQVMSLTLETPSETDRVRGEVVLEVYGSNCNRSEEVRGEVSSEVTLMNEKDVERQVKKDDKERIGPEDALLALEFYQNSALSDTSNSKQNKVKEDAGTGSTKATALPASPISNNNLESFHDTNEVKVAPAESLNLEGQEALLSNTESKISNSLTDSGVVLTLSDHEELLSPTIMDVFLSPTKTVARLSPEICLSPVQTEVLMSMTDQDFGPVELEDHEDTESLLSPSYMSDTCLSPVETKVYLSPNDEEDDEEACLSLTEANTHVRPVEKYILSTKEEGQSLSFSGEQALPEEGRDRIITILTKSVESLSFGSFKGKEGNRRTLTSTGSDLQLSSSIGRLEFGGPGSHGMIADKEEQLGFEGLIYRSVRDAKSPRDRYKDMSSIADNMDIQSSDVSPGGHYRSEDQKEVASVGSSVACNSGEMVASNNGTASDLGASFSGTAPNLSGTVNSNEEAVGVQGRFRRGSGEWMVYGGSLGHTRMSAPSTDSEESLSVVTDPVTSGPKTGRFGSRGSGEWMVYGGSLRLKSSLDAGASLPSEENKENPSVATDPVTSPPETGRFGSRWSGEWMVYGGSLEHKRSMDNGVSLPSTRSEESPSVAILPATSQPGAGQFGSRGSREWMVYGTSLKSMSTLAGNDGLPSAESEECPPVITQLATSLPEKGRFSSRGSGEWRFYGGSTGHVSSLAGSDSVSNAESKDRPSVVTQQATSPPVAQGGRFGIGGSGEWRVYGGRTGRLSSVGSANRVNANDGQVISPPSSYTSSGPRLSSAGSGGRLSSSSVVRRSNSVGSGGKLTTSGSGGRLSSSPGSHRISSSGRLSGSGEWKSVYSSASGRRSSAGSIGRSGGGRTTSSRRAPSPGGRMNVSGGSGGWLNSSTAGGNRISSAGSGSKLSGSGSNDKISGGRISSSSGSGRTNSMGGRVISSNDWPIRSTGSGTGGNKERISVCKMAALSISAAGRERSQDRQRQAQRSQQHQQQQAAATSPLVHHWLTTDVGVTGAEPDGLDDIMHL
ncbi:uncharacterized protein [Trachinotus anak]|uniref:uncharacterized protein n=1 Tax=Trachinotus anak TaxID=443729 RepID=UPI0039F17F96